MDIAKFYLARDRQRVEKWQGRYISEQNRIEEIIDDSSNGYGDYLGSSELIVADSRRDGCRVQMLDGWNRWNRPLKHVEYRTTPLLRELRTRFDDAKRHAKRKARRRSAYKKALAAERAENSDSVLPSHVRSLRKRATRDPYALLLNELRNADIANERAKSRAADGVHFDDFDCGWFKDANYRRSRDARVSDYEDKRWSLFHAVEASELLSLPYGHHASDEHVPFILYWQLPTGQVSFHSTNDFNTQPFISPWDGTYGTSRHIRLAIREYLAK